MSRNAHKSVISGAIVSGIEPVWVHPTFDPQLELAHPPEADDVRRALAAHPDAKGMLLISPTDYGTCADIKAVADVCHQAGIPLIVDEAWGGGLPVPRRAAGLGHAGVRGPGRHQRSQDGAAVEQSSVFHLQGDLVDPYVLKAREDLLGTTSSSSLVYLTLDGWRRWMVEYGADLLTQALARAGRLRAAIDDLDGLAVMSKEAVLAGGAHDLDPLKITIDVQALGISGYQAADWLRADQHVDVGMSDHRRIQAQITCGDDDTTESRLLDALTRLVKASPTFDRRPSGCRPPKRCSSSWPCGRGTRSSPQPSRSLWGRRPAASQPRWPPRIHPASRRSAPASG